MFTHIHLNRVKTLDRIFHQDSVIDVKMKDYSSVSSGTGGIPVCLHF